MKKFLLLLPVVLCLFCACSQDEDDAMGSGRATLALDVVRGNVPQIASRAVDAGLAVKMLYSDGTVYKAFTAGNVPSKIDLEPGVTYTLVAYSDNQDNWVTANNGLGEACYYATTEVCAAEDETAYCTLQVPMTNYAVALSLHELFPSLFPSYTFTLTSGSRTLQLHEGEKAYFSTEDGGFSYALQTTNLDGETFSHEVRQVSDVQHGMLYKVCYGFSSDSSVSATQNMEEP